MVWSCRPYSKFIPRRAWLPIGGMWAYCNDWDYPDDVLFEQVIPLHKQVSACYGYIGNGLLRVVYSHLGVSENACGGAGCSK
jgi:hypothetical protein